MISDGKNREANTELDTFTFKAKENGVTLITIQGEFYDQAETKLEPSLEPIEIQIGEQDEIATNNELEANNHIINQGNMTTMELHEEIDLRSTSTDENNANLAALHLNKEGLSPTFQKDVKEYYLIVGNDVTSLRITAIPENTESIIEITGNQGFQSGLNTVEIKVTSANKKQTSNYKIYVTKTNKKEQTNTNLQTLAIENAVLSPELTEQSTNYTASVDNNVTSLNILAVPEDEKATVKIEGTENLKEGDNEVTVTILAQNNVTFKKYRIHVTRKTIAQMEEEEAQRAENANQLEEIVQNLEQNQEGILQTEIEEQNNQEEENNNIAENILIDNSKEIEKAEQTQDKEETQNGLFIIGGILVVLVVIGVIVIVWKKRK